MTDQTRIPPEFPKRHEMVYGEWREVSGDEAGETFHYFFVQCATCEKGLAFVASPDIIQSLGLEGAEESVERKAIEVWKKTSDCPHIQFEGMLA